MHAETALHDRNISSLEVRGREQCSEEEKVLSELFYHNALHIYLDTNGNFNVTETRGTRVT